MKMLVRVVSGVALVGTIVPAIQFFVGQATLDETKLRMLVATVVWFATAPLWTGRPSHE